jgi:hypothetical protein
MQPIKLAASCAEETRDTWHRRVRAITLTPGLLLEGKAVAAATDELIRILRKERAWVRLEDAVERVERAERLSRELTRELDRWRAEPIR